MSVSRKGLEGGGDVQGGGDQCEGRGGGGEGSLTRAHVTGVKLLSSLELSPSSPGTSQPSSISPVNSGDPGRNRDLKVNSIICSGYYM